MQTQHMQACNSKFLAVLQVVLMGGAESYRAQGSAPGLDGLDRLYPGEI